MSRNRPRGPRTHDHVVVQLAEAVAELAAAIKDTKPRGPELVSPELVPCRLLTVNHFGKWVEIKGRPKSASEHAEPSITHQGGVLVGVRLGAVGRGAEVAERGLVIQQGLEQKTVFTRVDAAVVVYPRSIR